MIIIINSFKIKKNGRRKYGRDGSFERLLRHFKEAYRKAKRIQQMLFTHAPAISLNRNYLVWIYDWILECRI